MKSLIYRVLQAVMITQCYRGFHFRTGIKRYLHKSLVVMMPEGPEVKSMVDEINYRLGLSHSEESTNTWYISDISIVSGRYLNKSMENFPTLLSVLPLKLHKIHCKGKFIYFLLSNSYSLWSTLGLTGGWMIATSNINPANIRFQVSLTQYQERGTAHRNETLQFFDMRNFGTFKVCATPALLEDKLSSLGHCWISSRPTLQQFQTMLSDAKTRTKPLAVFLMNQKKTAGVGNYLLSEILYECGFFPWVVCGDMDEKAVESLYYVTLRTVLQSYLSQTVNVSRQRYIATLEATLDEKERRLLLPAIEKPFRCKVYMQLTCPRGHVVKREDGPHKRKLHWVPQIQSRFKC